tara:strand:- start:225 stop:356 length:132 start_codon:yes stop_codon:yes gene_type:complete
MSYRANLYCFINDSGAVFLNSWDEAFNYAKDNIHKVDVKKLKL